MTPRPVTASLLLSLLSAPVLAADASAPPPRAQAAAVLYGDLGAPAAEALERRGLVITTGSGAERRLEAVAWGALERHLAAAPRLVALLDAYDAARRGSDGAETASFDDVLGLPAGGLLSAPLRAAAQALDARAAARAALGDAYPALAKAGSLYRTPWGRALAARTHADLGGSALDAAAEVLFSDDLEAASAPPGAAAHLEAWAAAARVDGLDAALDGARRAGALSDELEPLLARYLADEAALEAVTAANERLSDLERDREARRQLDDARAAAPALAKAPDLAQRLRGILAARAEGLPGRLSAGTLHVRAADGGTLEPGDKAVFSAAYWLDGLAGRGSAEVSEIVYRDAGDQGLELISRETRRRSDGGPFDVSVEAAVPESGSLDYKLVLDAQEAAPVELSASVPVSDALDAQRAEAARAEALAQACRLDESTTAWKSLLSELGSERKPARARLAEAARARLKAAEAWAADDSELMLSLDGARLHASPDTCDYRVERVQRSLTLLAGLPAGCDAAGSSPGGLSGELGRLMRQTGSRARLQEAFRDAVARAKEREAACKAGEAAKLYASGLALLDSDPGARCGDLEKEYAAVRMSDLPRAAAADRLGGALSAELGKARALSRKGDAAGALDVLLPLSTALRALPDARCWAAPLAEADSLADGAGVALAPGEQDARALPPDSTDETAAEAKRDWERRQSEREKAREAADSLQAPNAAEDAQ